MSRVLLFLVVVVLAGCKKVTYDTTYVVKTTCQFDAESEEFPAENVDGYCYFDVDTMTWFVASKEDARRGTITNRNTQEKKQFDLQGTLDENGYLNFQLTKINSMLSVYDKEREDYAWRQISIGGNMDKITIVLKFHRWREGSPLYLNKWWIEHNTDVE